MHIHKSHRLPMAFEQDENDSTHTGRQQGWSMCPQNMLNQSQAQGWSGRTGNTFPFYGLRHVHLILHGWARRIMGGTTVPRIKKFPTRKYVISGQRNHSAIWNQSMYQIQENRLIKKKESPLKELCEGFS